LDEIDDFFAEEEFDLFDEVEDLLEEVESFFVEADALFDEVSDLFDEEVDLFDEAELLFDEEVDLLDEVDDLFDVTVALFDELELLFEADDPLLEDLKDLEEFVLDISELFFIIVLFKLFDDSFASSLLFLLILSFEEDSVSLLLDDLAIFLFAFIYSLKVIHFVLSLLNR
jgi:hypothetical protein